MKFAQLLTYYREQARLNKKELADELGVKDTYIIMLEKGSKKPPTAERCEQIAKALKLNDKEKSKLFSLAYQERVETKNAGFISKVPAVEPPTGTTFEIKGFADAQIAVKKIPLVSWVSANRFGEATDSFAPGDAEEWVYTTARGKRMFALRVVNDCMEPEFREGERIIVDPDLAPANGDFVVIRDNKKDEATFKQLKQYGRKVVLHPLNPKYQDIELDHDKRYVIVGKVVGKDKKY